MISAGIRFVIQFSFFRNSFKTFYWLRVRKVLLLGIGKVKKDENKNYFVQVRKNCFSFFKQPDVERFENEGQ